MVNYCVDYYKIAGTWVDEGTLISDTCTERTVIIASLIEDGYTISDIYENEDCYCSARSWGECGCGNFKG
tara:strand:+ start:111 stop:320 length:210 start_codon:yes stop_codon:yes gene_type:complete